MIFLPFRGGTIESRKKLHQVKLHRSFSAPEKTSRGKNFTRKKLHWKKLHWKKLHEEKTASEKTARGKNFITRSMEKTSPEISSLETYSLCPMPCLMHWLLDARDNATTDEQQHNLVRQTRGDGVTSGNSHNSNGWISSLTDINTLHRLCPSRAHACRRA